MCEGVEVVVVDSDFLLVEWRVFGWLGDLDVSWDGIGWAFEWECFLKCFIRYATFCCRFICFGSQAISYYWILPLLLLQPFDAC